MSDPAQYTVGWICALTLEYVAARQFLDEEHESPACTPQNDKNVYTLGRVGKHHVVIAALPRGEYGTSSATAVATNMMTAFPNVRIGLMVGIGGGVPSDKNDVRLGDVVVSVPCEGGSGVFQYDFGKTIQNQAFQRVGWLNRPPNIALAAVGQLEAMYEELGNNIESDIEAIIQRKPRLAKKYGRPDSNEDRLYRPDAVHGRVRGLSDEACTTACSETGLINRPKRDAEENLVIHYGLIASANQVMKDAITRDRLAAERKGLLCFEMEAAGLMNHLPCLVIRGICDYADSHKSKNWQGFAAMAAAAYAKDLLVRIPPNSVESERPLRDCLETVAIEVRETANLVAEMSIDSRDSTLRKQRDDIYGWLSPPDESTNLNMALRLRHGTSGQWFLESERYLSWKTASNSFLWISGKPGCGKTILTSTVIQDLRNSAKNPPIFFYFDFQNTSKQSFEQLIRGLVFQCYSKKPGAQSLLDALYKECQSSDKRASQPNLDQLCDTLLDMLKVGETYLVIDAIDECPKRHEYPSRDLLGWVRSIHQSEANVHLLVTSRPESDIQLSFERWAQVQDNISLTDSLARGDIGRYIRARVQEHEGFRRWHRQPVLQDKIISTLEEKADGMFRWVTCQLDALENCPDPQTLLEALESVPATLDETYERIIKTIPLNYQEKMIRMLQFLIYSIKPMSVAAMVDALAVNPRHKTRFRPEDRMPNPQEITRYCSSLVTISSTDREVRLAHFSVMEWLLHAPPDLIITQHLKPAIACAEIASVCIAYLIEWEKFTMGVLNAMEAPGPHHGLLDRKFLNLRMSGDRSWPFSRRALEWAWYARQAEVSVESVPAMVIEFLNIAPHASSLRTCINPNKYWTLESENGLSTYNPSTLLRAACDLVLPRTVSRLVDMGADLHLNDRKSLNVLEKALLDGNEDVAVFILRALFLARPTERSQFEQQVLNGALHMSLLYRFKKPSLGLISLILKCGANSNALISWSDLSWYHQGYSCRDEQLEDFWKASVWDAYIPGSPFDKPLMSPIYSALQGRQPLEVIRLLVENGAEIDKPPRGIDEMYLEAYPNALCMFFYSLSYQSHRLTRDANPLSIGLFLLNAGVDIHRSMGSNGNTLHCASRLGKTWIIPHLLEKGADIEAWCEEYGTALTAASWAGNSEVVAMLLDKGAHVNAPGGQHGTAIIPALHQGHHEIMCMLFEKGADMNADGGKHIAIAFASFAAAVHESFMKSFDCVKDPEKYDGIETYRRSVQLIRPISLLLNNGADINARLETGQTALISVAQSNYPESVIILLHHGADADLRDESGRTALDIAMKRDGYAIKESRHSAESVSTEEGTPVDDELNSIVGDVETAIGKSDYLMASLLLETQAKRRSSRKHDMAQNAIEAVRWASWPTYLFIDMLLAREYNIKVTEKVIEWLRRSIRFGTARSKFWGKYTLGLFLSRAQESRSEGPAVSGLETDFPEGMNTWH